MLFIMENRREFHFFTESPNFCAVLQNMRENLNDFCFDHSQIILWILIPSMVNAWPLTQPSISHVIFMVSAKTWILEEKDFLERHLTHLFYQLQFTYMFWMRHLKIRFAKSSNEHCYRLGALLEIIIRMHTSRSVPVCQRRTEGSALCNRNVLVCLSLKYSLLYPWLSARVHFTSLLSVFGELPLLVIFKTSKTISGTALLECYIILLCIILCNF